MKTAPFILALLLATGAPAMAAPPAPAHAGAESAGQTFDSPEAALDALVRALRDDKPEEVQSVLGPGSGPLVNSGDRIADHEARERFVTAYDEHHAILEAAPDRRTVEVGNNNWPLPIPIVRVGDRWHFDSLIGAEELINRRIGRNEIAAIKTALDYVEAQNAFFTQNGQYARRIVSTPGKHDGLYWPAAAGEPPSPLADLAEQAAEAGYPLDPRRDRQLPYQGYLFRILTAQGPNAPGGARSYVSGGRMTEGYALIAWPVSYGVSGIMTFIVDKDGVVFQKDLGRQTAQTASRITRYDPDITWARIDLVNK